MNVKPFQGSLRDLAADWIALGLFEKQTLPPTPLQATALGNHVAQLLARKEFEGELGQQIALHGLEGISTDSVLLFGLGKQENFSAGAAYDAGVSVAKKLASRRRSVVAVGLPEGAESPANLSAMTEGLVVGVHGSGLRKREVDRHPFEQLLIVSSLEQNDLDSHTLAVQRGAIVGEAINLARDLVNTPPADKPPAILAERARHLASEVGLNTEIWDLSRLQEERFGGLLGVAAGSSQPPAFVLIDYQHGGDGPTLALVGKGVTFDSGGLSLKPSSSMENMKCDMTGSAVVLAVMIAAARLGLPVNLRGYMVLAENMTGGSALKLGDVLTMRNGKTVEVLNTDAEGRLMLADALSLAAESKPARLLDLATLTGACMVALGTEIAGLFTDDDDFAQDILDACRESGEFAWRLPLHEKYRTTLKSSIADLKNIGGKWGGAITAAKFLQEFVGETAWAHLDIAGPSWIDQETPTRDAGGTGCFVRTLVKFLEGGVVAARKS
ncbi:MAG: leucyl aminopeptidase [Isosphaeraceae bacterium]